MTVAEAAELAQSLEVPDAVRRLLDLPSGLHESVPEWVYHARVPGMASKSALDQVRRSPAHYRAWVDGQIERDTPALSLGKAIHCAILEPQRFARDYVVAPDFGDCRKRENKLARDAWNKDHAGATILRNADGMATLGMIRASVAHPLVAGLFDGGLSELTALWTDTTGLACKARIDHYRLDLATAVDIKSTACAEVSAFARDVWNYGYHRQADFYRSGLVTLAEPCDHFIFISIEKTPPHAIGLFILEPEAMRRAHEENAVLLERLSKCVERDEWPGYPETIQIIDLPPWARERT